MYNCLNSYMTKFLNITNIRTEISDIAKNTKKGLDVVLLKNGKPTLALLSYADFEEYKLWKEKQKNEKLVSTLADFAQKIRETKSGEKWLEEKGLKKESLSEEELLDLLYKDV